MSKEAAAVKHFNEEVLVEGVAIHHTLQEAFILGAKWMEEKYRSYIEYLEEGSFESWTQSEIQAYLTATTTIKLKEF